MGNPVAWNLRLWGGGSQHCCLLPHGATKAQDEEEGDFFGCLVHGLVRWHPESRIHWVHGRFIGELAMPSNPEPLDLRCIVTLAETLSFTETAKLRLHMTQPGVTARVNKVEKDHGYRTFDRTKGIVRATTPEGFVFVEEARQVLEHLELLIARSDAAQRAFRENLFVCRSHHA
ncbi:MAG: LysR family transcriptional regulator, partial [Terriglobia bacterium]